jgi:hypothetical protein
VGRRHGVCPVVWERGVRVGGIRASANIWTMVIVVGLVCGGEVREGEIISGGGGMSQKPRRANCTAQLAERR